MIINIAQKEIPIIGQKIQAHEGQLIASCTCLCKPNNIPMMILGLHHNVVCQHCRSVYAITGCKEYVKGRDPWPIIFVSHVGNFQNDGSVNQDENKDAERERVN